MPRKSDLDARLTSIEATLSRIEALLQPIRSFDEDIIRALEREKMKAEIDEANARLSAVLIAYEGLKAKR